MYLLELEAVKLSDQSVVTFRFGTDTYITEPSDTPANTEYVDRIIEPGSMRRAMYSDLRTSGASRVSAGDFVLANTDGALDYFVGYSFAGRSFKLLRGAKNAAFTSFIVVAVGVVTKVDYGFSKIVFHVRDKLELLNTSLLTDKFLGNNVLPDGVEGTQDDLKDVLKLRIYGRAYYFTPQLVNTSKLIYWCSGLAEFVYDRGRDITRESDYIDLADMLANAPSIGCYRALPSGYFRLGSNPTGQIYCDAVRGASAVNRTVAQLLKQVALDAGVVSGDIVNADITALDALNSAEVGIVVNGNDTAISVMDQLSSSIGAWYGYDPAGLLHVGRLSSPVTPTAIIDAVDVVDLERLSALDFSGGLVYKATLNYKKIWSVQTSDLDGAVPQDRRELISHEYRSVVSENSAVKTLNPLAEEMTLNTLLILLADANAELSRVYSLFSEPHELYKLTVKYTGSVYNFAAVLQLFYTRFGLESGKSFTVIAVESDFNNDNLIYTLWI